jgi:hypothetical protein
LLLTTGTGSWLLSVVAPVVPVSPLSSWFIVVIVDSSPF